jgi:hypothetical protein
MPSSIVNRRDSAKSNGGHSVEDVEVLSMVVQISFCLFADLRVLPFPLKDCSVFGNFVIALVCNPFIS